MKVKALKSQGISCVVDNLEVILKMSAVLDENKPFSVEDTIGYLESTTKLQSLISDSPHHEITSLTESSDFSDRNNWTFSKYVSTDIYNRYISKGQFQFGTIRYYQETEISKIRDEYEGYSNLQFGINNQQVLYSCFTGYNYLIFCGTRKTNSAQHQDQFGDKQIIIPNINSFAKSCHRALNSKSYTIGEVQYSNSKYYRASDLNLDHFDIDNPFSEEIINHIRKEAVFPSLFVKPEVFKNEEEIRIVFEMPKDQKRPLKISNRGLLDFIEIK